MHQDIQVSKLISNILLINLTIIENIQIKTH